MNTSKTTGIAEISTQILIASQPGPNVKVEKGGQNTC